MMKRSATEPIKPRKPIEPIKPINHQNRTDPFTALRDVFQKKNCSEGDIGPFSSYPLPP